MVENAMRGRLGTIALGNICLVATVIAATPAQVGYSTTPQEALKADASPAANPIGIRQGSTEYQVSCGEESDCDAVTLRMCANGHYVTAWKSQLDFDFVCKVDKPASQQSIQVFISPSCKWMYFPEFIDVDSNGKALKTKKRPKPDYVLWNPANALAMAYKDPRTAIALYVESDGRHIAAIDAQSKLLWVRNPWEEARVFCPYRTPRPVVNALTIVELNEYHRSILKSRGANLEHTFIKLTFDSSQFGLLDESTGDFFAEGQN
jgi:hypothetical protein